MQESDNGNKPEIIVRTYAWKGEEWVALYIDNKIVRLPLELEKAGWIAQKLSAPMYCTGETRNPEYFKRWGMQTKPPPLEKPNPGVIRHPHLRDDGTWGVAPCRLLSTGDDGVSGNNDSSIPDEP